MPLYEYKCRSCGEIFEVMQKFADAPLQVHEKCGGRVERLLSPPALQFKGSGWYVTDYAGNGKAESTKDAKKETSSSADSTTKPDTKTSSTKPATTSDKKV